MSMGTGTAVLIWSYQVWTQVGLKKRTTPARVSTKRDCHLTCTGHAVGRERTFFLFRVRTAGG